MPSTDEQELQFRRRAIYTGLKLYLNHDALFAAMCIWQKQYSTLPRFATSRFINFLVKAYDLKVKPSELQMALSRLLMAPLETLDEDPIEKMQVYATKPGHPCSHDSATSGSAEAIVETISNRVFRQFINELEAALLQRHPKSAEELTHTLIEKLPRKRLKPHFYSELSQWLEHRSSAFSSSLDESLLHDLVNAVYVMLCQRIGPVATDQLFGEITRKVEDSPHGSSYSPRNLM